MIYHTTGNPSAKTEGDRIEVTFPSGKDKAVFTLTLDQALWLYQVVRNEAHEALSTGGFARTEASGEVIAFPREVPSLVRREIEVVEMRGLLEHAAAMAARHPN